MKIILFVMCLLYLPIAFSIGKADVSAEEVLTLPEPLRLQALNKIGDKAYPQLIKTAFSNQKSLELRWKALISASQIRKEASIPDLKKALESDHWFMKNAALIAIQNVDPELAKVSAKELLNDKALVVRSAAVDVLAKSKDDDSRQLLWQQLFAQHNFRFKRSLWIRRQILDYLAASPRANEREFFLALSQEAEAEMKTLAQNALEQIKN